MFLNDRSLSNVAAVDFVRLVKVKVSLAELEAECRKAGRFCTSYPDLITTATDFIRTPFKALLHVQRSFTVEIELVTNDDLIAHDGRDDDSWFRDDRDAMMEAVMKCFQPILRSVRKRTPLKVLLQDELPRLKELDPFDWDSPKKLVRVIEEQKRKVL